MAEAPERLNFDKEIVNGRFPSDYFEAVWYGLFVASQSLVRYSNLADIQANIDAPFVDQTVQVTGQGTAIYKLTSTSPDVYTWVLASDDTTAIT